MAFYAKYFLELRDGFIVWSPYTLQHWMHTRRIPLDQFCMGSLKLQVEVERASISTEGQDLCAMSYVGDRDIGGAFYLPVFFLL
jgi:hypothetical protein